MKKRKIHRPGAPKLTAQNEQGEDEGIGVNAPVPFVFPRNEPKRVKILATWGFSHVLGSELKTNIHPSMKGGVLCSF